MFAIERHQAMASRLPTSTLQRWLLLAVVVAVLLVILARWALWPSEKGSVLPVAPVSSASVVQTGALAPAQSSSTTGHVSAQPDAVSTAVKPAARDPFLMPIPPPPEAPAPAVAAPPPPVLAAPIMPSAPQIQLSFMGRMQTPDGRNLVLAQWSDGAIVSLEQGKLLTNGFRVERLSANMVELLNPQTQAVVQLQLPPAPRFETR